MIGAMRQTAGYDRVRNQNKKPTNRSEERLALKIDGDKAFGGTDEHLAISEKAATSLRTLGRTAVRVSGSDCEWLDITHRTPSFVAKPMP